MELVRLKKRTQTWQVWGEEGGLISLIAFGVTVQEKHWRKPGRVELQDQLQLSLQQSIIFTVTTTFLCHVKMLERVTCIELRDQ